MDEQKQTEILNQIRELLAEISDTETLTRIACAACFCVCSINETDRLLANLEIPVVEGVVGIKGKLIYTIEPKVEADEEGGES